MKPRIVQPSCARRALLSGGGRRLGSPGLFVAHDQTYGKAHSRELLLLLASSSRKAGGGKGRVREWVGCGRNREVMVGGMSGGDEAHAGNSSSMTTPVDFVRLPQAQRFLFV